MNRLCYCVTNHPGTAASQFIRGVGGHLVYQVTHRQLSAVVSRVTQKELTPDLSKVKAFEWVVDSYHNQETVIPLRYGCVVSEESQVIQRLDEYGSHYETLLRELEGCVEMGLRVLLPSGSWAMVIPGGPEACREVTEPQPPDPGKAPKRPGLAYLTARKAHYADQDRWTKDYRQMAERCRAQFEGLFVKYKIEAPSPRLPLLSLYFLIPRESLASFRHTFRQLAQLESARFLLSGPWPPYNFVTSGPSLM
jgi:hypothetical protein